VPGTVFRNTSILPFEREEMITVPLSAVKFVPFATN
jgi:hypothetical protein